MTKAMINFEYDGSIYFDCVNHSDDHDVCTMVSAYCNLLIACCRRANIEPEVYESGHVRIYIKEPTNTVKELFRAMNDMLLATEDEYPNYLKIY